MTKNEYRELKPRIMENKVLTGTERDMICYELEKQIPKKYKLDGCMDSNGVFHAWSGINGRPYELCPSCEINLCTDGMLLSNKPKYCSNCGQRLDWSEAE